MGGRKSHEMGITCRNSVCSFNNRIIERPTVAISREMVIPIAHVPYSNLNFGTIAIQSVSAFISISMRLASFSKRDSSIDKNCTPQGRLRCDDSSAKKRLVGFQNIQKWYHLLMVMSYLKVTNCYLSVFPKSSGNKSGKCPSQIIRSYESELEFSTRRFVKAWWLSGEK